MMTRKEMMTTAPHFHVQCRLRAIANHDPARARPRERERLCHNPVYVAVYCTELEDRMEHIRYYTIGVLTPNLHRYWPRSDVTSRYLQTA